MTKKDYIATASIIKDTFRGSWSERYQEMIDSLRKDAAEAFANRFESDNPNFDRSRFMLACGVRKKRSDDLYR